MPNPIKQTLAAILRDKISEGIVLHEVVDEVYEQVVEPLMEVATASNN